MVHKTIIMVLTSAGLVAALVGMFGYANPVLCSAHVADGLWCYVHSADGLLRLYAVHSDEDILLQPSGNGHFMTVVRRGDRSVCTQYYHGRPTQIEPFGVPVGRVLPVLGRRPVMLTGLRTPVAPLVGVLLVYPFASLLAAGLKRRRENRPGYCSQCGYNLTGNRSGVCPECGTEIDSRLLR